MSSRSEFAAAMEQAMHAAGEIKKTLAGAVGLTPQSIGRVLAGGQHPKKGTGYLIAKYLVQQLNGLIAAKKQGDRGTPRNRESPEGGIPGRIRKGVRRMLESRCTYYCRRPLCPGLRPSAGLIAEEEFPERRYVFEIDAMVWGKVVYNRRLAPWEIMRYGLISEPIE